jgi:hypothetical protein
VSVGADHDTSEFAVESIRQWWHKMGKSRYTKAEHLLITADCGGSNGYRARLCKVALQKFTDESGLKISVWTLPINVDSWLSLRYFTIGDVMGKKIQKYTTEYKKETVELLLHAKG